MTNESIFQLQQQNQQLQNQKSNQQLELERLKASYEKTKQNIASQGIKSSVTGGSDDTNIIKWQLDLDSLIERIEHILRGHNLKAEGGNVIWGSEGEPVLSELGVQKIMKILCMHINRDIILSNFDDDTIKWTVLDFSKELNELFYTERETFGITTQDKLKDVPMICGEIVRVVHSTYLRALNGGERESLSKQTLVRQDLTPQGQMMNQGMNMGSMPMKERSLLNPLRYLSSKYVMK
jgi:hypothetical protein